MKGVVPHKIISASLLTLAGSLAGTGASAAVWYESPSVIPKRYAQLVLSHNTGGVCIMPLGPASIGEK